MEKEPTFTTEKKEKEDNMEYPDFENLKNSKKIGANIYDVYDVELSQAAKEFEKFGLKITQIVPHKKEEQSYSHNCFYITVDWEEKK